MKFNYTLYKPQKVLRDVTASVNSYYRSKDVHVSPATKIGDVADMPKFNWPRKSTALKVKSRTAAISVATRHSQPAKTSAAATAPQKPTEPSVSRQPSIPMPGMRAYTPPHQSTARFQSFHSRVADLVSRRSSMLVRFAAPSALAVILGLSIMGISGRHSENVHAIADQQASATGQPGIAKEASKQQRTQRSNESRHSPQKSSDPDSAAAVTQPMQSEPAQSVAATSGPNMASQTNSAASTAPEKLESTPQPAASSATKTAEAAPPATATPKPAPSSAPIQPLAPPKQTPAPAQTPSTSSSQVPSEQPEPTPTSDGSPATSTGTPANNPQPAPDPSSGATQQMKPLSTQFPVSTPYFMVPGAKTTGQ